MQSKRRWSRDRSALLRVGAVGAALALALAGCGTLMPGGNTSAARPRRPRPRPARDPASPTTRVKVVFVAVDLDAVKKMTGFNTASVGDQKAQVQALEDWVNDNGGIGGKKLDAVFRLYDAQTDSPAAEEQLCNQITQDDQAFAVVMTGQYQTNARPCYAERQTLVLDASLYAMNQDYLDKYSPYLWTASFPEYDAFVRSYVQVLSEQELLRRRGRGRRGRRRLAGQPGDDRQPRGPAARGRRRRSPRSRGSTRPTPAPSSRASTQAAITFRSKGIDRVMFLGGSRLASVFATVAGSQDGFAPRYAISSFDNPSFFVNNPRHDPAGHDERAWSASASTRRRTCRTSELTFPTGDAETECLDIYDAGRHHLRVPRVRPRRAALLRRRPAAQARRRRVSTASLNAAAWAQVVDARTARRSRPRPASATRSATPAAPRPAATGCCAYDEAKGHFVYEGDEVPFDDE